MRLTSVLLAIVGGCLSLGAREFTVMVYNVENLFDVDGVALFEDYQPPVDAEGEGQSSGYGPGHLLTKVRNVARLIAAAAPGGPDIVALQELEWDRTEGQPDRDWEAFRQRFQGRTLEDMLRSPVAAEVSQLPAEAFLLKALEEIGLAGYTPVLPQIKAGDWLEGDRSIAHTNALFTRFPVRSARQHSAPGARDIHEVTLGIEGKNLTIFNNHWKSGASNPDFEPLRVGAAKVLRARVNQILRSDPEADILLVGDFNSHHNQHLVLPGIETGIHHILRSGDSEKALLQGGSDFYNLWYEKAPDQRGSEVWRGRWGTLMQMIVSRGLYDRRGIHYVDNSFRRIAVDGLNYDALADQPVRWHFFGKGGGFSDHLPVMASFRVEAGTAPEQPLWINLENPSQGGETQASPPLVEESRILQGQHPAHTVLQDADDDFLAANMGRFYQVNTKLLSAQPAAIAVGKRVFRLWSPDPALREKLQNGRFGDPLKFVGQLGFYRGNLQFVIPSAAFLNGE